jgi:uncharacterized protein YlaI
MENKCGLCERLKELTFHHFIPKTLHSNKYFRKMFSIEYMKTHGIDLCDDCHRQIHHFFTEKELGKNYNTKEKLLSDERVRKFLRWVKKQK